VPIAHAATAQDPMLWLLPIKQSENKKKMIERKEENRNLVPRTEVMEVRPLLDTRY